MLENFKISLPLALEIAFFLSLIALPFLFFSAGLAMGLMFVFLLLKGVEGLLGLSSRFLFVAVPSLAGKLSTSAVADTPYFMGPLPEGDISPLLFSIKYFLTELLDEIPFTE